MQSPGPTGKLTEEFGCLHALIQCGFATLVLSPRKEQYKKNVRAASSRAYTDAVRSCI